MAPAEQPPAAAPEGRPWRVRLVLAYDGAAFHGFAENPGVATVAGTLRRSVERVLRQPVELTGAGRTDTGVHARGQVVSLDVPEGTDLDALARRVTSMCAPALVVRRIEPAPSPDFDARFSARWRRYHYAVLNREVPDPFLAATAWHVPEPLHLPALRLACDPLIGEHDFSSFCRRPKGLEAPSMVRRVLAAGWSGPVDDVLTFEITGTAFCHQMVRSLVGTLVDVGRGRRTPGDVLAILRARDRARAAPVAPPHGLCLTEVGYDA